MKFPKPYTLQEIAALINTKYVGASDFKVLGMNEIHVVEAGDIVFVDHPKYYDKALNSAATTILINNCLLYTSPSPRDRQKSRMPSSA